jgi:hypothetical protein
MHRLELEIRHLVRDGNFLYDPCTLYEFNMKLIG